MAIPKHCGDLATVWLQPSGEGANGCCCCAAGQTPDVPAIQPAERRDGQPRGSGQPQPADSAQCGLTGVTERGEGRGEKRQCGAIHTGPVQISNSMGRAGDQGAAMARPDRRRPAAGSQMDAGAQGGCQPHIACNHQHQPSGTTDAGEVAADGCTVGVTVVPQHDPADAGRQAERRGARVRQASGVGEQPQRRQSAPSTGRHASPPCQQPRIAHASLRVVL